MANENQYCTFYLNGYFFGVEVLHVQEVIRPQQLTAVPMAAEEVAGLINLRGRIIMAIDLRKRLGFPEREERAMNVVMHTEDDVVSLQVDQIGDVIEVKPDDFETAPETLRGEAAELIRGAFKLDDRLLLILDVEKIVDFCGDSVTAMA